MNLLPPFLKQGDSIGIVAPARKIGKDELLPAVNAIKSWGLNVVEGDNLYSDFNQYSGTDRERAEDFQRMVNDPEIKAIICARGGYGCLRIIDSIDFSPLQKAPKWVIGYSDITVIHNHINRTIGLSTLHGTMPINFPKLGDSESTLSLKDTLFGDLSKISMPIHDLNRMGICEGILVGGNLSVLYSLLGSSSFPKTENAVLFIEDLDEYLYHIDRMMLAMKRAGVFSNLKGLVVGGMTDMNDNTVPFGKTAEEIIKEHVEEFDFPVCFNFPAGHVERNLAFILGGPVKLDVTKRCTWLSYQ